MLLRKMPCDMTAVVDHGCSGDVSYLTGERAVKKTSILATHNRRAGCSNQAKNSVTSRARLDEKYYDRRALTKLANQKPQFERIFGVFLQRDARLESSSPVRTLSQTSSSPVRTRSQPTSPCVNKPKILTNPATRFRPNFLLGPKSFHIKIGHRSRNTCSSSYYFYSTAVTAYA